MKRLLLAILLLAAIIGGAWWRHEKEARAARAAWQPLTGGGEVRLLAVTQGPVHRYDVPGPSFGKRIVDAIRTFSTAPLKGRPPGYSGGSVSTGRPGIGVWLELRGTQLNVLPQGAELILPSGYTLYTNGASGGTLGPGYHTTSIFDYIPVRAKRLRYACKLNGQRLEFEFANPSYRTDLPVWKGEPLPQMQQSGELALTVRSVKIERAPNYFHNAGEGWRALPAWKISRNGEPADRWFVVRVMFEDPSGQALRDCGMFEEPVWKLQCSLSRTDEYPFRDDEIQWLGTVGPEVPAEQETRILTIDPKAQALGAKLAGVFGPGVYCYQDGAIVETAPPEKPDPQKGPAFKTDFQAKKVRFNIEKPSVVIVGSAFYLYRDSEGHVARLNATNSYGGSVAGSIRVCALPKALVRIGTADNTQPEKFEFYISTPEKPGLKKPVVTKP